MKNLIATGILKEVVIKIKKKKIGYLNLEALYTRSWYLLQMIVTSFLQGKFLQPTWDIRSRSFILPNSLYTTSGFFSWNSLATTLAIHFPKKGKLARFKIPFFVLAENNLYADILCSSFSFCMTVLKSNSSSSRSSASLLLIPKALPSSLKSVNWSPTTRPGKGQ